MSREIPQPTDDGAVELLKNIPVNANRVARTFVPRTIVYPVMVEYKPGQFTQELRAYVTAENYVSENQWKVALELEKQYPKLNKEFRDGLKKQNIQVDFKEAGNPLKITLFEQR